jgi:hypothetical protein
VSVIEIAEEIRRDGLEPTMDLLCHNQDQDRRLARLDTPEVDSVIERVRALRTRPAPGLAGYVLVSLSQVEEMEDDVWFLVESNGREGRLGRTVAGRLESVAARAYAERAGEGVRKIANRIRRPLGTIHRAFDRTPDAEPVDPLEFVRACRDLVAELRRAPERALHSPEMRKELGKTKYELLGQLVGMDGARS